MSLKILTVARFSQFLFVFIHFCCVRHATSTGLLYATMVGVGKVGEWGGALNDSVLSFKFEGSYTRRHKMRTLYVGMFMSQNFKSRTELSESSCFRTQRGSGFSLPLLGFLSFYKMLARARRIKENVNEMSIVRNVCHM